MIFGLANPVPEIDPLEAQRHAAIVAKGRSDFPNQINNVLAFLASSGDSSTVRSAI
jgi:malate dehydrogenase (oxaloacetate-decarboxylating)